MKTKKQIPGWKDRILFTPGPLTTSRTVKQAMLRDVGSWDYELREVVKEIRLKLLEIAGANPRHYTTILMQGSGSFGLEAVIGSTVPPDGKLLAITNGAYGDRITTIASMLNIETVVIKSAENKTPDLDKIKSTLEVDSNITNVIVVHCETTTGIINPIEKIGEIVKQYPAKYIVDAMSSFGAVPIDLTELGIDYLVSSPNKCIEGVPGFSFIIAKLSSLMETQGYARSLCLDILGQYKGFEKNGQFRFTPPTHTLMAFGQAIAEFEAEGGVEARSARYQANYKTLIDGMGRIGFKEFLDPDDQGYIITSFYYPESDRFNFNEFYKRLHDKNYIIYSGKITFADTFRIGNIGRIFESDIYDLLAAIRQVTDQMGVRLK